MQEIIKARIENWDTAKAIYKTVADMELLKDYPQIDLGGLLFSLSHDQIVNLANVIIGNEEEKTLTESQRIISHFLLLIFNKIVTEPEFCELLKLITVIPTPQPVKAESSDLPDLSTN